MVEGWFAVGAARSNRGGLSRARCVKPLDPLVPARRASLHLRIASIVVVRWLSGKTAASAWQDYSFTTVCLVVGVDGLSA